MKVYVVNWFNYIGNADMTSFVKSDSELEAALIVHSNFWTTQRKFDFSDYQVSEFEDYSILERKDSRWTDEEFNTSKENAIKEYIENEFKYYKDTEENREYFVRDCREKLDIDEDRTKELIKELCDER